MALPDPLPVLEVSLLDLPADVVAAVEIDCDVPYEQWQQAPKGKWYPALRAALTDEDRAELGRLSMRVLIPSVKLTDDALEDPTPPVVSPGQSSPAG